MEKMLESAEAFTPYKWDRYDVIVLPPSFLGGMENPYDIFNPTIISGDRLTSLIAHD